ncbi:CsiV family protein [Thalassotalea sp. ND16A]|uniref:CsiV family protein n=1 Tax=Thalassotalea sp. ND16A TaxID=1535422 RepID=UPI000AF2CC02|nr:CsiV family protein [Thalassotalea sp. ND16A]
MNKPNTNLLKFPSIIVQARQSVSAGIIALSLIASAPTYAQTKTAAQPAERWFEIEVILLEQLMDKARYGENFQQESIVVPPASQAPANIDFLNQYLQRITLFQQQLTSCSDEEQELATDIENTEQSDEEDSQQQYADAENELESLPDTSASQQPYTEQKAEITTLASVEQQLKAVSLSCKKHDLDLFEHTVDKQFYQIPRTISGSEDLYAKVPYLLDKDSLQLTHIHKSLRRSKAFRPVLHIGWRQAVVDRNRAKPVRLLAGENLGLIAEERQMKVALEPQLQLSEQQKQQMTSEHISQIIADVKAGNSNLSESTQLLKQSDITPLFSEQEHSNVTQADNEELPQTWKIDGLFKVHLNHYLFINSQFNVIANVEHNKEDGKQHTTEQILIPFKQNRRVISGEVHYFDHPYIGMIVQIRRHEKPEAIEIPESDTLAPAANQPVSP